MRIMRERNKSYVKGVESETAIETLLGICSKIQFSLPSFAAVERENSVGF
jgi:hypothetical protein